MDLKKTGLVVVGYVAAVTSFESKKSPGRFYYSAALYVSDHPQNCEIRLPDDFPRSSLEPGKLVQIRCSFIVDKFGPRLTAIKLDSVQ